MEKETKEVIDFNSLSPAEQRVVIAQDVIDNVISYKYKAYCGAYVRWISISKKDIGLNCVDSIYYSDDASLSDIENLDIKSNFDKIKECTVCAMGACLLSITKYKNQLVFNDLKNSDIHKNSKINKLFSEIFDPKQLLLIECAFEPDGDNSLSMRYARDAFGAGLTSEESKACESFYHFNIGQNYRLIAIMQNIITNKGIFIP